MVYKIQCDCRFGFSMKFWFCNNLDNTDYLTLIILLLNQYKSFYPRFACLRGQITTYYYTPFRKHLLQLFGWLPIVQNFIENPNLQSKMFSDNVWNCLFWGLVSFVPKIEQHSLTTFVKSRQIPKMIKDSDSTLNSVSRKPSRILYGRTYLQTQLHSQPPLHLKNENKKIGFPKQNQN